MRSTLSYALPCPKCGVAAGARCVNRDGSPASRSHVNRTPQMPCGTFGGYQRHKRAGEVPCDECRDANRRYMQEYREKHPEVRQRDIAQARAYTEAMRLLIDRHRAEFDALYADLKAVAK